MRILMKKGKQKELLKKVRELQDLSWLEFAEKLGLKFGKLWSFVYEYACIDENTFNKLSLKKDYEKYILKKLPDNWGLVKGGQTSPGNTKNMKIPEMNEELAEFWGILLGDGNINKTRGYKLGVYNINISGHRILDKDYLLNFVQPLGEKLFDIGGRSYYAKYNQGLRIIFDSRKLVDFFEKENFKSGDKIINRVTIPNWIKENPKFLAACLRGLYDTDGCFYKLTNQNSYQVGFTNYNKTLLNSVRDSLLSLGIGVSKISRGRDITITKRSEIAKFYKLVGFHNSKHLNKIKVWNAKFSPLVKRSIIRAFGARVPGSNPGGAIYYLRRK